MGVQAVPVGILHYATQAFDFNDVVLAHLRFVVVQKIRKRESFYVNWTRDPGVGSGRVSIWVSPEIPLAFYMPELAEKDWHPEWVAQMMEEGNSVHGITVRGISTKDARERSPRERSLLSA
ncbi:DUF7882 family protein [Leucobacter tardus]|uniref:DUF7882 family protein n=1 Tax=Leucobacter tardus TaxID=501483 RepID=UPI003F8D7D8B